MAPYVKRIYTLGTPTLGTNGIADSYKILGIAFKYNKGLNGGAMAAGTDAAVHT